jgi:hexosaminidase
MAYPRACATAEVVWSTEKDSYNTFLLRLNTQLQRLRAAEVNFRPLDEYRTKAAQTTRPGR